MKKLLLSFSILLFISLCLWAQNVPQTIDYQGRLADSDGNYLNSVVTVDFLIYDATTGGTLLWSETQDVSTANGIFHVLLGSTVSFPTDLFDNADRWLELIVSGETLVPRTVIASVPYAIQAETAYTLQNMGSGSGLDADLLDGQDSSDFMPATTTFGDITSVTAGTGLNGGGTSGDVTLNVDIPLNLNGNVSALYGIVSGVNNDNGSGVYGRHSNSGNYGILGSINYGVYGLNDPDNNYSGNFGGLGSSNYGVYGMNDISNNYGYFGSADYGVYGGNSSSGNYAYLGSSNYGVYGKHDNSSNYGFLGSYDRGVYGGNYTDYGSGVYGRDNASTGGYGVWGHHWNSGNHGYIGSSDYGVYGKHDSSGNHGYLGSAVCGVYGSASSGSGVYGSNSSGNFGLLGSSNAGVYGYNTALTGAGVQGISTGYFGGYFTANYPSTNSHVVHAEFTGTSNNGAVAVYGKSRPADRWGYGGLFEGGRFGVYGNVFPTGNYSYTGIRGYVYGGSGYNVAIDGYAYGLGTNIGINGFAVGGSTNYAGYFSGNVHVTGTFTNPSDERFKENVQPFKNALSKVRLMDVHTFNFIQMAEEKQLVLPEGDQIGLIAQELEEIIPELVEDIVHAYDKNEGIEGAESDMEKIEYKGINYIGLIPVLIEAVKELQVINEEQQRQIDELLRSTGN